MTDFARHALQRFILVEIAAWFEVRSAVGWMVKPLLGNVNIEQGSRRQKPMMAPGSRGGGDSFHPIVVLASSPSTGPARLNFRSRRRE